MNKHSNKLVDLLQGSHGFETDQTRERNKEIWNQAVHACMDVLNDRPPRHHAKVHLLKELKGIIRIFDVDGSEWVAASSVDKLPSHYIHNNIYTGELNLKISSGYIKPTVIGCPEPVKEPSVMEVIGHIKTL